MADPERTQSRILARLLRRNAATAFGREHGFGTIRSLEEFRQRLPLTDHGTLLPWVRRIMAGETAVLTAEPVLRLVPTSGTSEAVKWLPFTASLQREFRAAIAPWVWSLYREQPALLGGRSYWSITPVTSVTPPPSAVPAGFDSDSAYLGGWWGHLVESVMAVPGSVARAPTMEEFWERTVQALGAARDLRLISVWHSSFLEILLDRIGGDHRELWPQLGLISCWADGPAALGVAALAERFPGVRIQAKGLLATEGVVSLPLGAEHPLAITSHFLEFLDEHDRCLLAHELQPGGIYSVLLTTGGGLYRYRLRDRIQVKGMVARTPSVRFLGKEEQISDLRGEKLGEDFVARVLAKVFSDASLAPRFAMLAPASSRARYLLFLEIDACPPADLAARIDAAFGDNPHYRHCRALGQLDEVGLFRIAARGYAAYLDACGRRGQRAGNVKPRALSPADDWERVFPGQLTDALAPP